MKILISRSLYPKTVSSSRKTWWVNSGSKTSAASMSASVRTRRNCTTSLASHTKGERVCSSDASAAVGAEEIGVGATAGRLGIFAGLAAWGGGAPPILASRASSLRRLASCCSSMVVIEEDCAKCGLSGNLSKFLNFSHGALTAPRAD